MPQLLQPYNPWFMGIEAATAAAIIGGAIDKAPSMGVIAGIAIAVGSWNYYVQREYPVPEKLVHVRKALEAKRILHKGLIQQAADASMSSLTESEMGVTTGWDAAISSVMSNPAKRNPAAQF